MKNSIMRNNDGSLHLQSAWTALGQGLYGKYERTLTLPEAMYAYRVDGKIKVDEHCREADWQRRSPLSL